MHVSNRSYLTAGVAALGVGAIALAPIQPLPNQVALAPQRTLSNVAVDLTASIDPITPWVDAFKAAAANGAALNATWWAKPFPILQTITANQYTYLSELETIGIGGVLNQMVTNIGNAVKAPFVADPLNISDAVVAYTVPLSIPVNQQLVYSLLPDVLGPTYDKIKPLIDFTTMPISGLLFGFAGPGISATLSLVDSVQAIIKATDFNTALNELINIPANMVNAALNGGKTLDLTGVIKALGIALPDTVKSIGLQFGGALNAGGVGFDALAASTSIKVGPATVSVDDPGIPVGFVGAIGTTANKIADAIKVTPAPGAARTARTAKPAAAKAAGAVAPAGDAAGDSATPTLTSAGATSDAPKAASARKAGRDGGGKSASKRAAARAH